MGTSLRTKSVRTIQKIGLKYRFDYQFGRHLTDSVKNNRNPKRPFLSFTRFVDIASQHWLRPIKLAFQLLADFRQKLFYTDYIFDVFQILLIDSRCTLVGLYALPGLQYNIFTIDLIVKSPESPIQRLPVGFCLSGVPVYPHIILTI